MIEESVPSKLSSSFPFVVKLKSVCAITSAIFAFFKSATFEIHEDSQPMINAQKRNVSQSRFKHMRTKHHYIRKLIFDGWCKLIKIQSKMNTADMATKILPASTVSIFSKIVLGLQDSLLYFSESDD